MIFSFKSIMPVLFLRKSNVGYILSGKGAIGVSLRNALKSGETYL
ncbi:hypothetical protein BOVAC2_3575 [Bacteroides ovatus]|nr:hypothetical protein BOVAC2_3575 [Bacteroides ovatus]CDM01839.1 hypothetical protein BN891_47810 [Bacteroides xylanisolvens SD CC 2a]